MLKKLHTLTGTDRVVLSGVLLGGAGAIAFSGKAVIVKLAYRYGVDAVTLIMYRMLLALPLFLLLSWRAGRGKRPLSWHEWKMLFGLGFFGFYLASFLDFAGLQYINASLERLILYLNPTVVLGLSALLFKSKVTMRQWRALAVSYAGVMLVFGHDVRLSGSHVALGAGLVFCSAVSYALYLVLSGEAVKTIGAFRLTGFATSIACVLCIVQFLLLRPLSALYVAPPVIWLSILNATLCTVFPVLLITMALERVGPGVTAQTGMIGPLSTIALSIALLDEPFTSWMAAGTALVLAGIWLLAPWKTTTPVD
jgi:drug/metabolite transporter (DMT)-like permease